MAYQKNIGSLKKSDIHLRMSFFLCNFAAQNCFDMKKISFLFLALVCAMNIMAETVKIDGLYYSLGTTTATLVKDQTSDQSTYKAYINVTVPASVYYNNYTYPVTTIGTSAFEYCSNLQSVTLPNSITVINTDAFYGCTKLGDVNLPEGLTTINLRAFYNCNLDTIVIPSTVTSIGNKAFYNNPIKSITWLPANCSVGTVEDSPFYNTSSKVTSFTFGPNVKTVPSYICYNMNLLDTIVLPPSVNSLGTYAFAFCSNLKSINLPVTQKTLPISFLEGCTSLESIELPATLTTISSDAFYGCSKLANVTLHEGITTINQRAFYNCKLAAITIPQSVTSIGPKAFQGNPTTSVTWLPKNCSISTDDSAPFYNTSSKITSFVFGDSVEVIPAYLCKNMNLLDTIVLPPSVNSLGTYAFAFCSNLKSINLPVTQKTLPISFLEGCTSLESIELPATLTTISSDAFYGCSKLANVTLHEGITTINQRAFYNCKLAAITIPQSVTSIGPKAFQGNPTTSVTWLPKNCSISTGDSSPFYSTSSKITSFVFGDSVQTIPGYLCYSMNKLENVVLPENLTTIGQYAFNSCSLLNDVTIPASMTSIGTYAFAFCTSIKHFEFPAGIKTLTTSVLEGSTGLEEVIIPASVTTINQDAFYNCSKLMAIHNYAITPQSIPTRALYNVNKQTCILYVPIDYINLYQAADVWKEFYNIIGVQTDLQFEDQIVNVTYLKPDSSLYYMESQTWAVPHEPHIEGFTFVGWQVKAGMLEKGIVLQAVYQSNDPTNTSNVVVNPANKAQKLIRHGNVYILQDDKIYTLQGQRVQ